MDIDHESVMNRENNNNDGLFKRLWWWLVALPGRFIDKIVEITRKTIKLGKDDPRRVIHSLKVGFTLSLVTLLYYFKPIYGGLGSSTMWAILTVVVVFEFSVGATLGKGFNRAAATLLAGALGLGAHHLAILAGDKGHPVILWFFVFLLATTASFSRFFPGIKARYDYGVLIFILTFSLVSVSGYRVDKIIELAHQRVSTIIIGCISCVLISIFVFPVWAGQDLHKHTANNIEKLSKFLQGFGEEYFGKEIVENESQSNDVVSGTRDESFLHGYRAVLNSKAAEESLANFARWEPPHGSFRFGHPWKHYLKVGTLTRQCAYRLEALNNCITSPQIQAPSEFKKIIREACMEISMECGMALHGLSTSITNMTYPSIVLTHITNSKTAAHNLKTALRTVTLENSNILEDVIPAATVTSLLIETIAFIEKIAESVNELACLAKFEGYDLAPLNSPEKPKRRLLRRENIKPQRERSFGPQLLRRGTIKQNQADIDATDALITVSMLATAMGESESLDDLV